MSQFGPYRITGRVSDAVPPNLRDRAAPNHWAIVEQNCGATLDEGLYRFHTDESATRTRPQLSQGFAAPDDVLPFGFDWLGRQFALVEDAIVLYEPGTGMHLQIPGDLRSFHEIEIVAEADAALAMSFFREWRRHGNAGPSFEQCVGYRVPLFLGGADSVENLELIDLDVYLELSTQLIRDVRNSPVGTRIQQLKRD